MIDTKSESFSSKIEKIFGLEVGLDRKETDEQLRRAIAAEKEREERERGSRIQFLANLKQMAALSNKSAASSYLLQKIPQPPSVFSAFRSNSSPFAVWSAMSSQPFRCSYSPTRSLRVIWSTLGSDPSELLLAESDRTPATRPRLVLLHAYTNKRGEEGGEELRFGHPPDISNNTRKPTPLSLTIVSIDIVLSPSRSPLLRSLRARAIGNSSDRDLGNGK
ncbi:hypothetical protein BHM03_00009611 [Ensete ventricosum]|nr:hypothetical protein BHM03_00009611 [Ensete ventricosum]